VWSRPGQPLRCGSGRTSGALERLRGPDGELRVDALLLSWPPTCRGHRLRGHAARAAHHARPPVRRTTHLLVVPRLEAPRVDTTRAVRPPVGRETDDPCGWLSPVAPRPSLRISTETWAPVSGSTYSVAAGARFSVAAQSPTAARVKTWRRSPHCAAAAARSRRHRWWPATSRCRLTEADFARHRTRWSPKPSTRNFRSWAAAPNSPARTTPPERAS